MAGYGDDLIATGLAAGAAARGKKIAFGNGRTLAWYERSEMIFRNNPNIARHGEEQGADVEWIDYRKGHRIYNRDGGDRWIWNYDFRPQSGELYFSAEEKRTYCDKFNFPFVVIEPNVEWHKRSAKNKDWGTHKYQAVADYLIRGGCEVIQFEVGPVRLKNVMHVRTKDFRHSMVVVQKAMLVVTPEGGLHHGAAAVGTQAVVLFGGWIPPEATGYRMHSNVTAPGEACGRYDECSHCRQAMEQISVDQVINEAEKILYEHSCYERRQVQASDAAGRV